MCHINSSPTDRTDIMRMLFVFKLTMQISGKTTPKQFRKVNEEWDF